MGFLRDPVLVISLLLIIAFVGVAIIAPIYKMVEESRTEKGRELFDRYLDSPVYRQIIRNTIKMGLIVGALGTALGFLMAYVQVKTSLPFNRFKHYMALVPVISPPFAVATSVLLLFGRNGMISKGIFDYRYDIYGLDGLSLVLTLSLFTVAYLNLKGMMQALDPALDEAATNLGASKFRIFRTVTLPMLLPGIASSFLLIFVEAVADLGNPLVLSGKYDVLATRVYVAIVGLYNTTSAAVLSIILLVPSLMVFIVQRYWVNRLSVISVTGKPSGKPQQITHPLVRWPLFSAAMFVALLIVLIYAVIFVGSFVRVLNVDNSFTLDHFDFVIYGYGSEAMKDTTRLSALATPIAGILGMLIAFIVVRKKFLGRGLLDFGTMLGIAVPGTILGIGYLLMFNRPHTADLPLLGTVEWMPKLTGSKAIGGGALAIILIYIIRSTPAALRTGVSALSQIDPVIEEASVSLGAGSFGTFRRVTLPLIRPAFFSGLVYAFARSMTTISAIVFLTTPKTKIMTQQILNEVENGRYGNAFAYCVILIVIVLTAIGILAAVVGTRSGTERTIEGGA